jgi:hypothetical protein
VTVCVAMRETLREVWRGGGRRGATGGGVPESGRTQAPRLCPVAAGTGRPNKTPCFSVLESTQSCCSAPPRTPRHRTAQEAALFWHGHALHMALLNMPHSMCDPAFRRQHRAMRSAHHVYSCRIHVRAAYAAYGLDAPCPACPRGISAAARRDRLASGGAGTSRCRGPPWRRSSGRRPGTARSTSRSAGRSRGRPSV